MYELISGPWPWYVTGPLIGLMVPLLLFLLNKPFGISTTFHDICAMCVPNTNLDFFKFNRKARLWNLVFALGVVLGAVIVVSFIPNEGAVEISDNTKAYLQEQGITDFKGLIPTDIFSWENLSSPVTLILLCVGGFLIGFGTRYAGGCTSGHAIMGMSTFSKASFVAVAGFFAGGLLMTWIILPQILKWL